MINYTIKVYLARSGEDSGRFCKLGENNAYIFYAIRCAGSSRTKNEPPGNSSGWQAYEAVFPAWPGV